MLTKRVLNTLFVIFMTMFMVLGASQVTQATPVEVSSNDYSNGSWMTSGPIKVEMDRTETIMLDSGKVFAYSPNLGADEYAQIYNPKTDKWAITPQKLGITSATALDNGNIMIVDKDYETDTIALYEFNVESNKLTLIGKPPVKWKNAEVVSQFNDEVLLLAKSYAIECKNHLCIGIPAYIPVWFNLNTKEWDTSEDPIDLEVGTSIVQIDHLNKNEILISLQARGVIYNHITKEQKQLAPLPYTHYSPHLAGVLPDGNILFAGGWSNSTQQTMDSFIYNPKTNQWSKTTPLPSPRSNYAKLALPNGEIMLIGGLNNDGGVGGVYLKNTLIFDPESQSWNEAPSLKFGRVNAAANLLHDGRILAFGGMSTYYVYSKAAEELHPHGYSYTKSSHKLHLAKWRDTATSRLNSILAMNKSALSEYSRNELTVQSDGSGAVYITSSKHSQIFVVDYLDTNTRELQMPLVASKLVNRDPIRVDPYIRNDIKGLLIDYLNANSVQQTSELTSALNNLKSFDTSIVINTGNHTIELTKVKSGIYDMELMVVMERVS
ncbi:Kelch repeat-containing protein [Aureibacillus halotolerans]|uniref:Kelch motif protein n=1 Tax=Aureibacillus halotolerans TaxID=1508390 RepID=A0A4R6TV73_9BACI|nr:kelch repeat-containing protein [Aureibacillus halotolerans]TDQ37670.1 Kelch motif protein [Aureibacillus halotolerans]